MTALARLLIEAGYFPAGLPTDPTLARAMLRQALEHLLSSGVASVPSTCSQHSITSEAVA